MSTIRIALANLEYPSSPDESVRLAGRAIVAAAAPRRRNRLLSGVLVPRLPRPGEAGAPARSSLSRSRLGGRRGSGQGRLDRRRPRHQTFVDDRLRISTLIVDPDGTIAGFQDKVQLDPSEEPTFTAGTERSIFRAGPLTYGVVICHEGWRYPETARWAARGAQVVFHGAFHEAEPGFHCPTTFADPANTFHEKAALCRAAENTCFFATVNYASDGSPTTSAVVRPDGTVQCYQPYGVSGLLVADLDLTEATGLLASRCRY